MIEPYGGTLVDLRVPTAERARLKAYANRLPSLALDSGRIRMLSWLACGALSPLDHFLGRDDLESVLTHQRLADGTLFPWPVAFPVEDRAELAVGSDLALRDRAGHLLATMTVEELVSWNPGEAVRKLRAQGVERGGLTAEMATWGSRAVSGRLRVFELPRSYEFPDLHLDPARLRNQLEGWQPEATVLLVVRQPPHRGFLDTVQELLEGGQAVVLAAPLDTTPRALATLASLRRLLSGTLAGQPVALTGWSSWPPAAGRELLMEAIAARNLGCDFLAVESQRYEWVLDVLGPYQDEIGLELLPLEERAYAEAGWQRAGTGSKWDWLQVKQVLATGADFPPGLVDPEVAQIWRLQADGLSGQGGCVWITGLRGSGKTTTAENLAAELRLRGRTVSVLEPADVPLDGPYQDQDEMMRLIEVAAHIVEHGGLVVVADPGWSRALRNWARERIGADAFWETWLDTPLPVCEGRDAKGVYARLRRGPGRSVQPLNAGYEPPLEPDLQLDGQARSVRENVELILADLTRRGLVIGPGGPIT